MTAEPTRILLADDEPLYRGTVRALLDAEPDLEVVAEAGTGREACALARRSPVDVAVVDVRMPDLDGVAATRHLTALPHAPKVLVLTTFDLDEAVHETLRAGAGGFLLKDVPPTRLVEAVRTIAAGDPLLAPSVTRRLIDTLVRAPRTGPRPLHGVTAREREVLTLVTRGLSNAEIQERLHLSQHTVKTHIGHLMAKLAARDRAQLVIAGYEAGLVDP
ncbi:response regulator [Saccharothrix syringae]|uniref:Response regulator transcription factor n=1 Tax=Saccharothrix syringae TaxID=103733 RepID=A0A5Q0H044_SACSY|nr:response regulator transcription factor [Saccharothrix syringae]QFZ19224.1 response regulator transcription factor [Saccharothrix syringae]